mgnify:CR=1 FL=1
MPMYKPIGISIMTAVETIEIEIEITKLFASELTKLRGWVMSFDSDKWDVQIENLNKGLG